MHEDSLCDALRDCNWAQRTNYVNGILRRGYTFSVVYGIHLEIWQLKKSSLSQKCAISDYQK